MKNKPKISILITSFTSGGAEKVISLLLKPMIKDFEVTLVLFYNEIHFPIPKEVDVILLSNAQPSSSFLKKIADLFKFYRSYKKLVTNKKIQYSVSFLAFPNLINGLLSKRKRTLKTILSERGFPSDNTTSKVSHLISKISYPLLYNRCDSLFSNSTFINKDLKDNFGVKIPMEVIYNPIEIPEKVMDPNSLLRTLKPFKLITIGSVDKRKNQIMVIRALQKLSNLPIQFQIFGAGPLEEHLKREIEKLDLSGQVFLKGKTKQVNEKLLDSHVFILSSFTEGFPNALMEAMADGLPCISTNCLSGPLEMLNENNEITIQKGGFEKAKYGILINNNDVEGLVKAISYLMENPEERKRFSELSLERAKNYGLERIYLQFKNYIARY